MSVVVLRFVRLWLVPVVLVLVSAIVLGACRGPESEEDDRPSPTVNPNATGTVAPAPEDPTATATQSAPAATATTAPALPTATAVPPVDLNRIALGIEQVGEGFTDPVFVTHAGDGSGRVFVLEKIGRVRLLDGSSFLDISDRVLSPPAPTREQEMGLFGLAFHPRFAENGYLYVHYINLAQDHIISRFQVGPDGLPDPSAEKVLLQFPQPDVNFCGGMLAFGADGYLYIGTGTGGEAIELNAQAQELGNLYGKILRIDVDGGDPYAIPPDNPFVDVEGARPEVWAYGLRNPYRFAFDRANGDLYIGGPGQYAWEWINYHPVEGLGGQHYGWPMLEGTHCWDAWTGPCDTTGVTLPIYERPTYGNGNCVIIGGYVYRGPSYPIIDGVYLFGDYCSGRVWGLARDEAGIWQSRELLTLSGDAGGVLLTSFGEDEAGELYVTDIDDGAIYRFTASAQ